MKTPAGVNTGETKLKAFLVTVRDEKVSAKEAASFAEELSGLAYTLGLDVVSQEMVHVREKNTRYGMGTGKADELAKKASSLEADCIVFDRDFSPSQQRNWEELPSCKDAGISVVDRQELIIQIFASRAQTREAELQVRLAELEYSLPRLQHRYIDLSRQRGGRYGTKGSGETKLETDRRQVEQKIHRLKKELEKVKCQRQVRRKLRERQRLPVCALAGYTNAGKSSIMNALTNAGVLVEDRLFATLDSTSRRLELSGGELSGQRSSRQVLLVDTVGFIRRLPHSLIKAFRSTLEEVSAADIILIILDASSQDKDGGTLVSQYETTLSVLRELGAETIPMITVLNKIDKLKSKDDLEAVSALFPGSVSVSAKEGTGLKELCKHIENRLPGISPDGSPNKGFTG